MLVAVLNTCTKEELEEHDEDLPIMSPTAVSVETAERRKIIKNKIMAVGRMARVFALLRYVVQMAFSSYFNIFFFGIQRGIREGFRAQECPWIIQASIRYSCVWHGGN